MEQFRRTFAGAFLQTHQVMGLPITVPQHTTINEKLSIFADLQLGVNEVPKMRYLTIGNRGHKLTTGTDGFPLLDNEQHKATDAGLFNFFPFVLRPADADLSGTERAKYGLRRVENIGGVDYVAYYAMRLDMTNVVPKGVMKTIVNDVTTSVDYIPQSSDLSPVPVDIANGGAVTLQGKYICVVAELTVVLTPEEVQEILDAALIKHNNVKYAMISELGLTSGVDRSVNTTDHLGGTLTYNEIVAAQIFTHVATIVPMQAQTQGFSLTLDVGATEPLFALEAP